MSEKTIEIKSIVERADYHALRNYYMYRRTSQRTKIMAYIFLASLLLLVLSETPIGSVVFRLIGITGIIIIAVMYSIISIDTRPLENNMRKLVNLKQELNLGENGITVKWAGYEQEAHDWLELEYAYENDAHFFLFLEKQRAAIIPKLLLNEHKAKEIHDFLDNHIKLINDSTGWKYQKI